MAVSTQTYIKIDVNDQAVITLLDGEAFYTKKYLIGQRFVTAVGNWNGTKEQTTQMFPISSIRSINLSFAEVSEAEVPIDQRSTQPNEAQSAG